MGVFYTTNCPGPKKGPPHITINDLKITPMIMYTLHYNLKTTLISAPTPPPPLSSQWGILINALGVH